MSLYDGWNGLQIGQSINDGLRRRQEREEARWNALGRLVADQGSFADSIYGYYKKKGEDDRARRAGLSVAGNIGMKDAESVAAGMRGEDFLKYALGLQDTMNSEARAEKTYQDHRAQDVKDKVYASLKDAYLQSIAKASVGVPSESELREKGQIYDSIIEFVRKNPEYAGLLSGGAGTSQGSSIPGWKGFPYELPKVGTEQPTAPETDWSKANFGDLKSVEDFHKFFESLHGADGTVDTERFGNFIKEAQTAGKFSDIYKQFKDEIDLLVSEQGGDDALKRKGLNFVFGDKKTSGDVAKEVQAKEKEQKIKNEMSAAVAWANKKRSERGQKPTLSDEAIKRMKADRKRYGATLRVLGIK